MKILIALFTLVVGWLITAKQALGFTKTDINTATFTESNLIPEYDDPGTRQWGGRVANNTAANNRLAGRAMIIDNETFTGAQEKTYDTDRDYRNSYMNVKMYYDVTTQALPRQSLDDGDWTFQTTIKITTTEASLDKAVVPVWKIKALNGGGFTIINNSALSTWFVTAVITEHRQITGA